MITGKQYRLMKSVLKNNGTTAQDTENHEMYRYLASKGFLHKQPVRGYEGYVVTQDGEVEMKIYREDSNHVLLWMENWRGPEAYD